MCECYYEPCKICGCMIPMHLEDFKTSRGEIIVVCVPCLKRWEGERLGEYLKKFPFIEYTYRQDDVKCRPNKGIRVYALTKNAWEYRSGNTPNTDHKIILKSEG